MTKANIYEDIPASAASELFKTLSQCGPVKIERIISYGQSSPAQGWYQQQEHEWILLLQGAARLQFDDGSETPLAAGDYLLLEAGRRHKVSWTDPEQATLWLAVFFPAQGE